jgi:hypothetical protein
MCLIVDMNAARDAIGEGLSADYEPIRKALLSGKARLMYGGRLASEYARDHSIARTVVQLDRAGVALRFRDSDIDGQEKKVKAAGLCKSNDTHIIALAQLSGARVLCSGDQNLHTDFTNNKLLSKPGGRVYQNSTHAHLIKKHC